MGGTWDFAPWAKENVWGLAHGVLWGSCAVEIRLATRWEGAPVAWGVLGISPQGPRKIFWVCPMGQGTCLIFDWPGQRMQGSKGKRQRARGQKGEKGKGTRQRQQAKGTGAKTSPLSPEEEGFGHCLATKHRSWLDPPVLPPGGLSLMWGRCLVEIRLATWKGKGGTSGLGGYLGFRPMGQGKCLGLGPWSVMGKLCGRNPSGY